MKMGEYIKAMRLQRGWTQEELGKLLNPSVNRAAVNKWEAGRVSNIKRNHIEQLARIFNVDPVKLMCFDTTEPASLTAGQEEILSLYDQLNLQGQQEAIKRVEELTYIPRYTAHLMPVAAHTLTPYDKDDPGHAADDAIMENDKEWN